MPPRGRPPRGLGFCASRAVVEIEQARASRIALPIAEASLHRVRRPLGLEQILSATCVPGGRDRWRGELRDRAAGLQRGFPTRG